MAGGRGVRGQQELKSPTTTNFFLHPTRPRHQLRFRLLPIHVCLATQPRGVLLRWCFAPPHPVDCQWFSPGWNTELKFGLPSWSFTYVSSTSTLKALKATTRGVNLNEQPATSRLPARSKIARAIFSQLAFSRAPRALLLSFARLWAFILHNQTPTTTAATPASIVLWYSP